MGKRIIVEIGPDGSAAAFPEPADGIRAALIDRDSIEAEVLRRLADRVLDQEAVEGMPEGMHVDGPMPGSSR